MASKTESQVQVSVGMTQWKIRLGAEGLSVHWTIRPALADVTLTLEPFAPKRLPCRGSVSCKRGEC